MKKIALMLPLVFIFLVSAEIARTGEDDFSPAAQKALEKASEIQKEVEDLRGLKFKIDIPKKIIKPEGVRKRYEKAFEEYSTPQDWKDLTNSLLVWGFISEEIDLKKLLLDMMADSVGGFYDPKDKELYLVDRGGESTDQMQVIQNNMVLAHELTHALEDQHFNLDLKGQAEVEDEIEAAGDVSLAWTCFMEGTATYNGFDYMFRSMGQNIKSMMLSRLLKSQISSSMSADPKIKQLPEIFMQIQALPYYAGTGLMEKIFENGSWEDVAPLYEDPPVSTEQILHPEKYLGEKRDYPISISLENLKKSLGDNWREVDADVVGEFCVRLIFRQFAMHTSAPELAAGWDGDAYVISENKDTGRLILVWRSIWDTEADAAEFAEGMNTVITRKYHEEKLALSAENNYFLYETELGYALVQRDLYEVVVMERIPANLFEELYSKLWDAPISADSRDTDAPPAATRVKWKPRTWVDWTKNK